MAKIIIHQMLDRWHRDYRPAQVRQYVDDLPQRMEGTRRQILRQFPAAAVRLASDLARLRLDLSPKSILIASEPRLRTELHCTLVGAGLAISKGFSGRDLGIDNTAASRRTRTTIFKRIAKAKGKTKKTRRLGLRNRGKARRLLNTAVLPQMAWGHQIQGTPPTTLKRLRATLVSAAPGYRFGTCTTTLLALTSTPDPAIHFPLEQVMTWIDLWRDSPEMRPRLQRAWQRIRTTMSSKTATARWRHARGPLGALIATLLDHGWTPTAADRWEDPAGQGWQIDGDPYDHTHLHQHLHHAFGKKLWQQAAAHHLGQGLEDGAYMEPMLGYLGSLRKHGRTREAGTLQAAASAGLWLPARLADAGYDVSPGCPRCGAAREDELHRIWKCPCIDANASIIKATTHIADRAEQLCQDTPALLLRGLCPTAWVEDIPPPPDHTHTHVDGCFAPLPADAPLQLENLGHLYSDGTGGIHQSTAIMRRCAWALVAISKHTEQTGLHLTQPTHLNHPLEGKVRAALAGPRQTVNRAELMPLLWLAQHTVGSGTLHSDSAYVVDGFAKQRHLHPAGSNADLWHALQQALAHRPGTILVHKVKANHGDQTHITCAQDVQRFVDNELADHHAGDMAAQPEVQIDDGIARNHGLRMQQLRLIQRRIIHCHQAALADAPPRQRAKKKPAAPPPHAPTPPAAPADLADELEVEDAPADLAGEFSGRGFRRIASTSAAPYTVGKHHAHHTHHLCSYRGLAFCTRCGSYTSQAGMGKSKLTKPCQPQGLRSKNRKSPGQAQLDRLLAGLTPKPGMCWPAEHDHENCDE